MKRSRFTEQQVIGVLREQQAGLKTADVCRKHGISADKGDPASKVWEEAWRKRKRPLHCRRMPSVPLNE